MAAEITLITRLQELLSGDGPSAATAFTQELCSLIAEAISSADEPALTLARKQLSLRDDQYAVVGEVAHQAIRLLHPLAPAQAIEPGSYAHRFLELIASTSGLSNGELVDQLAADETEVSRVGRKLLEGGYASRQKIGRRNAWAISARGLTALDLLDA